MDSTFTPIMIPRLIFWAIAIYFLYRFVFNFLIPVLIAGGKIKKQMKDMREHVNGFNHTGPFEKNTKIKKEEKIEKKGDYIDFEEIK